MIDSTSVRTLMSGRGVKHGPRNWETGKRFPICFLMIHAFNNKMISDCDSDGSGRPS